MSQRAQHISAAAPAPRQDIPALTVRRPATYIARLPRPRHERLPRDPDRPRAMSDIDLTSLERKIDELVQLCDQLARENQALSQRHGDWAAERAQLIEKNELAKSKVEAMISRLRSLEQDG